MTKTLTKIWLLALLTVVFTGFLEMRAYAAETSEAKSLSGYTEEEKKQYIDTINKKLDELKDTAQNFQSKFSEFNSQTYTYQLNDAEVNRRADNRQFWAQVAFLSLAKDRDERAQKIASQTHTQKYSSFISNANGALTKELKWKKSDKKIAQQNGINLDGIDFSNTDVYWERVISRAQAQASIEKYPNNGANKAITAAESLDDIKSTMIKQHEYIKSLLIGLDPASNISATCPTPVAEGETCPNPVYTVVNEKGKATTGASKGCKPLPVRYAEIQSCILCPMFQVILSTDQNIATESYGALASSFRNLIIVVLALFIAYQTLITVSSFTKQDTPKYISTLLVQSFKVLVAAILLSNSTYIYQYVINPLMSAGLEFGLALLFDPQLLSEYNTLVRDEASGMPPGVIGQDLLASVMAAVRLFSKASAQMPAIGSSLICISMHEASNILPDFSMLIEGVLVFAFGWAIALACCFYLLDSVVRFGIFCALLPFLIASWPFKVTASYTKNGWDIFMNAFFNFVMMGMVISLNSELISQALTGGGGGMDALESAINGSEVETLKELMDISGVDFLVLIACCMFAFKLVGQINELANQVSGTSGGTGIGNKIGGAAAQAAKKVAGAGAKMAGKAAGAVYEGTGAKAKVDAAKDKAMGGLAKAGAKIGLGPKANPNGAGGGDKGGGDKGGDDKGGGDKGGDDKGGGDKGGDDKGGGDKGGGDKGGDPGGGGGNSGQNGG